VILEIEKMVSVIISLYNIEKVKRYFMKAIYYVLSQENVELELLLINDGFKDRSKEILEKSLKKIKKLGLFIRRMEE